MHDDKQNLINLVADVQNGVEGAFEKLYHETVKIAYTHASMILKNRQDIEDVLQNSYMKVAENIGELKKPESFELWLGTIVKRECLKYTEKNSRLNDAFVRFRKVKERELMANEQVLSDAVENGETRETVRKALDKLSEKKRMCLVLYYFEQNSVSEIAEIMNISEGTVLSRIYYARKSFENEFEKLRKKDESLLGVAAIPLFVSFLAYQAKNIAVPSAIEGAVAASVTASGVTAASSTTAVTSAAATSTVSAAGGTAATAVATKIAAVAVAASVAAGGGVAVVNHIQERNEETTTVQSVSSALTEEHATVAAVFAEETSLTQVMTTENTTYSGTVQISEILSVKEETATHAVQTPETEKTAVTVTEAQKTKIQRISREYTLEPADTTALITTVKPTETTAEKTVTAAEETTEEETTEKETTTRRVTTTAEETTTEKPTTTEAPTTDASEVYGISGGVINEYTGSESKLAIPSKIGSSSVTAIGASAFEGNTDIESVSVPSGVTKIGQTAFADCTNLSSVSLPSTLTSIGAGAFCGCTSLSGVTIPSGVTTIGDDAFADCSSLSTVTVPSSVTSIGENAFGGCDNLTLKCSEGSAAHDYAVENSINYELV